MIKKIDHLGIAVKSLDEAVPYYEEALGLKCEHREEVPSQKVRTAFFNCGEVHIELLELPVRKARLPSFWKRIPAVASITLRSARTTFRNSSARRPGRCEVDSRQTI